jgi:hypothetical protein
MGSKGLLAETQSNEWRPLHEVVEKLGPEDDCLEIEVWLHSLETILRVS